MSLHGFASSGFSWAAIGIGIVIDADSERIIAGIGFGVCNTAPPGV
jgi:hypothetical protein